MLTVFSHMCIIAWLDNSINYYGIREAADNFYASYFTDRQEYIGANQSRPYNASYAWSSSEF